MSPASTGGQLLYPHLRGDLTANPPLLQRLEKLAANSGKTFDITSGLRTYAQQQTLWNNRASNPYPVARPGTSTHETGNASDVTVDGKPIQDAYPSQILEASGLKPLKGDAVHVDLLTGSPSYVNGGIVGGAAGAVKDAGQAIRDAPANAAAAAAKATANALVGLAVDAIGRDGARVLLSIALVIAGVALVGIGAARALGVQQPVRSALKTGRAAAALAA